jgi:hypothetical protein
VGKNKRERRCGPVGELTKWFLFYSMVFLFSGLIQFKTDSNLNEFYSELKPKILNNTK